MSKVFVETLIDKIEKHNIQLGFNYFSSFYSLNVSEKQLKLLIKERTKAKLASKSAYWNEISKILNTEGPCVKSASRWKRVSIEFYWEVIKKYLI